MPSLISLDALGIQERPRWIEAASASRSREGRAPTFALYTLGCKVNQSDSHQIARALLAGGFERVEFRESADLYVIDTCTVTAEADRKSRKAAARAHRNNPEALVAVTGCAATLCAEQFARVAPGALVLPNARKFELPELAARHLRENEKTSAQWHEKYLQWRAEQPIEPVPQATRERAVVKIQDGCNHNCSYCIIPSVRGVSVLKPRDQIVREARMCVAEGARELVITGVSMGDWGRVGDCGREPRIGSSRRGRNTELCELLREVAQVEGLERLRVSSLDPADVDEEWLECVASTPKLCPQIHLALQSGSAGVLRRMRRRYTPALFLKWARRWREMRPDGGLTTDVIVGFPGEIEDEWRETLAVVREARFSHVHAFPFSPREGTHAATLPGAVDPGVQKRRVEQLIRLGEELSAQFAQQFAGREEEILVEQSRPQEGGGFEIEGLTPSYLKCLARSDRPFAKADVARVQVLGWRDGALRAALAAS
jgi:threonylcarbamoyladenosine tRNA methylthiotransferase MtaB